MKFGLGIDTGGTYTDSVILDMGTGNVLSKAKAPTTREDLSKGISNSLSQLDRDLFPCIKLVSLSSTLATNSVVEGKGSRVALIAIGEEYSLSVPTEKRIKVKGRHDLAGEETEPLDVDKAKGFILEVRDFVDAFAVSGYLGVRNPEHEVETKELISTLTHLPVVCGHELSTDLGFQERTLTAVLNARLIPVISELISSAKLILEELQIQAPLMIMKGDGSIMSEKVARERPVETILSGPAASINGAKYLTDEEDAVIIDMGGTTTDIGILRDGMPRLDPEGARIANWRTRVRAISVSTGGIGGDSRIVVNRGNIRLLPNRVIPLCHACSIYPRIRERLEKLDLDEKYSDPTYIDKSRLYQPTDFLIFNRIPKNFRLGNEDWQILSVLEEGPGLLTDLKERTGILPFSYSISRLEEYGVISRVGLTPTDILHVEGSYVIHDPSASILAVRFYSERLGTSPKEFCTMVKQKVIDEISRELLRKLVYEETRETSYCPVADHLVEMMVAGMRGPDYSCRMDLHKKIIGIGAPVETYLPSVARNMGTELIVPDHSEVGNAVGAITGSIIETVEILIQPKPGMAGLEDPPCSVHLPGEKKDFERLSQAIAYARELGEEIVVSRARQSGAHGIEVFKEEEPIALSGLENGDRDLLIQLNMVFRSIGKPMQFYERA
ncbi:MAG: hydantoinase/oxoprolinase family protein [Methanomassiliicoccales archaeon]|nr:hydantoinase/oxoprolinase family protein [Methanomassiliicoccales archaeon]NYT16297.1 hydantoinase/oxoprolinase family protein [Methanomassiliicoccales archaeon]